MSEAQLPINPRIHPTLCPVAQPAPPAGQVSQEAENGTQAAVMITRF